jgi:hypothetical protein
MLARRLLCVAVALLACAPRVVVDARRRRGASDMRDIRVALDRLERGQEELARRQRALDKQEHDLMGIVCPNATPLQGLPADICARLNASTASGATTRTLDRENRARTAAILVCFLKAALAVWVIGLFL